ncbi:DUF551 domain-containing protein [Enterobacter ludwigii]|uniref:DUF551 domain-containing protein n=1 Tax=Enterobacter ludwigii TaxID=299767 RepID=UPI002A80D9AF|nr:DUF551 domain-containing protein [Enterobacter ludwigii]
MSTITKEQAKDLRNAFHCWQQDYDPVEDKEQYDMFGLGMVAMDALLASLEAEEFILYRERNPYNGLTTGWQELTEDEYEFIKDNAGENAEFRTVYTAPPAPILPDESLSAMEEVLRISDRDHEAWHKAKSAIADCRAAMLQGAEPVSNRDELPLVYLQGHKDGLEWAAQLAEANHPQTGDWLYDDPIELAKAIRKGPDMPEADGNSPVVQDGVCLCCGRKQLKNRTCSVAGCDGKHVAHGFCKKHYDIERKKDPSRRESIRAADERYRARKSAAQLQEMK